VKKLEKLQLVSGLSRCHVVVLEDKPKDNWEKSRIVAAALVPVVIAIVGVTVGLFETNASQEISRVQSDIAEISANVERAELVFRYSQALVSEDKEEKLGAINSVVMALPVRGPTFC
jgi:hypothetical protein